MLIRRSAILLGATMLTAFAAAPSQAQEVSQTPATVDDLANQIEFLKAQLEAMQSQLADLKKATAQATPVFKGAPEVKSADGFTFKPRGLLQFDAGYVENPGDRVATKNLGFGARGRRLLLGVQGTMPGGFNYVGVFNFANNNVAYEDMYIEYAPASKPWSVQVGYYWPYQSLDQVTSNRFVSFIERSRGVDAFGYTRRLGVGLGYYPKDIPLRLNAGLFFNDINNNFNNDQWQASARAVWAPLTDMGQFHLGANFQYRKFQSDSQGFNYQTRPFTQTTDIRFISTGPLAADHDTIAGIEFGGIFQSLHVAGEAQWAKVSTFRPGTVFTGGDAAPAGAAFTSGDPALFAGYAEVGYFLTGETRGYSKGRWDRTKVLNPFDKGGWGAVQLNARVDYVDLRDRVGGGTALTTPTFINGGKQLGLATSVIWHPMDYIRFMGQYARAGVEGGPRAATIVPTSTDPAPDRNYSVDTFTLRAQLEF